MDKVADTDGTSKEVNHHMEMNVHATEQVEKALQASKQKTEERTACERGKKGNKSSREELKQKYKNTLKALRDQEHTMKQVIEENEHQLERISTLQEVIEHTTEKMKQAVEALEEKKGEFTVLEKLKKDLESSHEELQKTYLKTLKDNLTLKERKTQLKSVVLGQESVILTLQQTEKSLQENLNLYYSKLRHYEHSVKQLNEEKEDLLNRVSVFASDRLTHENTRITDLSDPDRPTRLSEVYSELYDNEWTDAYEELIGKGCLSPEGSIELLREILLKAFQACTQITWDRYEAMKTVTVTLDNSQQLKLTSEKSVEQQEQRSEEPMDATDQDFVMVETTDTGSRPSEYTTGQSCGEDNIDADYTPECTKADREKPIRLLSFSIDEEKEIKKVWKITSNAIKTNALEVLRSLLVTYFKINAKEMPNLTKYLTSCLELCWKMGIQEKPMHLDTGEGKDSNSQMVFDQVRFKAYTKPGKNVAYIVWPALCLYKGGDILNKGVAQGC